MRYFDLHCDTLYRAVTENSSLNDKSFHLYSDASSRFAKWTQCFAIWIRDDIAFDKTREIFYKAAEKLKKDCEKYGFKLYESGDKMSERTAVFTVEGGRLIGSDLDMISELAKNSVKILTLTWNGDNNIACGALSENDMGLTEFGRRALIELERNKIIVDVSHLSDKSFYDVACRAEAPFIATHSNSRAVCKNKRNLTDEQFKIIRDRGGVVGINFHRYFLKKNGEADISDILRHCEHFLSLGGENTLSIGSDFDGSELPRGISSVESIPKLYELFLRENYPESLLDKLFYSNAANFFETFDNRDILL